jgi:hypothetical protein
MSIERTPVKNKRLNFATILAKMIKKAILYVASDGG